MIKVDRKVRWTYKKCMTAGLDDTHPRIKRVQIGLLRQATIVQRFSLVRSLSQTTMQLAWRAIERANPGATEDELAVKFAMIHYGPELAERLRIYLAQISK